MNFNKILFAIIISLFGQHAFAQTKVIILRIDTLIQNDYYLDFSIKTQNSKILMPYLIRDSSCTIDYRNNSLTCRVQLQNDSSTIKISLDEKGGYLELSNLDYLKADTLRISKFTVYNRPSSDTNWISTSYWYLKADTLCENYKNTQKLKVNKVKKMNLAPIETMYTINGETYQCKTTWENIGYEIAKSHGRGHTSIFNGRQAFYFHRTIKSSLTVNRIYLSLRNNQ